VAKNIVNNPDGKALVIVESPAKAKTINKYLGANFTVKASMGHVRDLPEKGIGVDIENRFTPTYEVLASRKKLITELRAAAKTCSEVYLATDLDREGEAIAWHLAHALGLDEKTAKRVVFNEITKTAITNAFKIPRLIDIGKVNAQQARRILDRLVGYKVSPLLWKKVARGLSAGRVQSVAVKLIVEREHEINAFIPDEFWKLTGVFTTNLVQAGDLAAQWQSFLAGEEEAEADDGTDSAVATASRTVAEKTEWMNLNRAFRADLVEFAGKKFDPKDFNAAQQAAQAVGLEGIEIQTVDNDGTNGPRGVPAKGPALKITRLIGQVAQGPDAPQFVVRDLTSKQSTSRPPAPFSTSTLQQAASNQLGFGAQRTMRTAQQLYEGVELEGIGALGLITYMRTDSLNLSQDAITMARSFITDRFGQKYLPEAPNVYSSRAGAQEAHEAIRPTDVNLIPSEIRRSLDDSQFKLYELIWKRFVACQMTPAQWLVTEALIDAKSQNSSVATFKATGRQLVFDGFTKVAGLYARFDEQLLPKLDLAQRVAPLDLTPTQHFTAPPPRYTEASLVKALESEGIGRPSTYASIITTIQDRQYVENRDRRFFATDLGIKVTEKLIEGFPDLMDTSFTRKIESELDQVEEAHRDWVEVVHDFYDPHDACAGRGAAVGVQVPDVRGDDGLSAQQAWEAVFVLLALSGMQGGAECGPRGQAGAAGADGIHVSGVRQADDQAVGPIWAVLWLQWISGMQDAAAGGSQDGFAVASQAAGGRYGDQVPQVRQEEPAGACGQAWGVSQLRRVSALSRDAAGGTVGGVQGVGGREEVPAR